MRLSDKLLALRREHHLTQQELSQNLFLSQRAYNHYEKETTIPPLWRLLDIAKYYGITLSELFEGVDRV